MREKITHCFLGQRKREMQIKAEALKETGRIKPDNAR